MSVKKAREHLDRLKDRLVEGEIDLPAFRLLRDEILADLSPENREAFGTFTPQPQTPIPTPQAGVIPTAPDPHPATPAPDQHDAATPGPTIGPSGERAGGLRTSLPSLAQLDLSPGKVLFDQWRIERELGRGGFGAVCEAEDLHLGKVLAVKVLDPAMVARRELLARFRREVLVMRDLVHGNIVRVYDYREDLSRDLALFSMEYVAGCTVRELKAEAKSRNELVPIPLALRVLGQTLEALAAAHEQGVIHRDVTPGNILLAGGSAGELLDTPSADPGVKLVDFGIAGLVDRTELSERSRVLGTAAYVAPEVLDPDGQVTAAADLYGAGAVAYELLTGVLPVGMIELPREFRQELPKSVNELLVSMLKRAPARRPTIGRALREVRAIRQDLERRQAVEPGRAGQDVTGRPAHEKAGSAASGASVTLSVRRKGLLGLAAVAVAVLAVAVWTQLPTAEDLGPQPEEEPSAAGQPSRDDPQTQLAEEPALPAQPSVEDLQAEFAEATANERWTQAREAVTEVAALDASAAEDWQQELDAAIEAQSGRLQAERDRETRSRRVTELADAVEAAIVAGNWQHARSSVQEVRSLAPADSRVAAWEQQIDQGSRNASLAAEIQSLISTGERPEAEQKIDEYERLVPGDARLAAWRESVAKMPVVDPRSGVTWVTIPAGSFTMGCTSGDTECDTDESPRHEVRIAIPFQMAATETTNAQYQRCVEAGACREPGDTSVYRDSSMGEHPVVEVSWNDARAYCEWAGGRLPTEAEWEYAARGGSNDWKYPWGNTLSHENANYSGTAGRDQWGRTAPVGSFAPNGYGLYDMAGNVWEWVEDAWHGNYNGAPGDSRAWVAGGNTSLRVVRGGSWYFNPGYLRVSGRYGVTTDNRNLSSGFRCTRTDLLNS